MAEGPNHIEKKLQGQLEEILSLYDLAEKAYPYQNIRGGIRPLNEDEHRKQAVAFSTYGAGSENIVYGTSLTGLASLYLFSRRGSKHLLDFSMMRKCYIRTFSWWMIGVSFGTAYCILQTPTKGRDLNLHRHVH